jgi:hypothetical protein
MSITVDFGEDGNGITHSVKLGRFEMQKVIGSEKAEPSCQQQDKQDNKNDDSAGAFQSSDDVVHRGFLDGLQHYRARRQADQKAMAGTVTTISPVTLYSASYS